MREPGRPSETPPPDAARTHGVALRRIGAPRRRLAAVHLRDPARPRDRGPDLYKPGSPGHFDAARPVRPARRQQAVCDEAAGQRGQLPAAHRADLLRRSSSSSARLGGYLLAKQALRPIAKLTQTARALSTETLDQRINLGGPDDELRELADTFDDMLARLDAAFDSQRLFVANASHELRTPLSVIRTELEVTLSDPDADPEELRRMGEVVVDGHRTGPAAGHLAAHPGPAAGGRRRRARGHRAGRPRLAGARRAERGRRRGRREGYPRRDRDRAGRHARRSAAARAADRQPGRERHPAQPAGRLAADHAPARPPTRCGCTSPTAAR